MVIATPLPDSPDGLVPFETSWPVRLADTDSDQRLRLDAVARYLQDIGYEHLEVSDDGDNHRGWVVRRTVFDVLEPLVFGERATLRRWSSALSNRWCNMRVQIVGDRGGRIETEAFLIHFGEDSGLPTRMSEKFMAPMLAHTTEHRLRWKAALTEPMPGPDDDDVHAMHFPLRITDLDWLGHVNNAVHLHAIEEFLAVDPSLMKPPYRVVIEYGKPLMAGEDVLVLGRRDGSALDVWFGVGAGMRAVARVSPLEA